MQSVANVNFKQAPNVINFKAVENDRRRVYSAPTMPNDQVLLQRMMAEQQKKEKKQKLKQNISWGVGIASGLAIILAVVWNFRALKSGGAKQQINELTQTLIKWTDFNGGKRKTAELSAGTTHKNIKKQFDLIKDLNVLSEEAKKYSGVTEQADIFYVYGYGGTGKTYCTEQIAEDMKALYTCIKYPDLGSPFKDAASMKISKFFEDIVETANKNPDRNIVVCIDEADALIQKVSEKALSDEAKKVRSAVITGIDNITNNAKNVKLFLTSNYHPDSGIVDDVVLRRVNKKLRVDLPDYDQANALLKMYMAKMGAIKPEFYETNEYKQFVSKIISNDNERGYSGGEIKNIVTEAIKEFASTLKDIPDNELTKHPFKVEFLENALETVGAPAARTNTTMLTEAERIAMNIS